MGTDSFSCCRKQAFETSYYKRLHRKPSFCLVFSCPKIAVCIPAMLWEGAVLTASTMVSSSSTTPAPSSSAALIPSVFAQADSQLRRSSPNPLHLHTPVLSSCLPSHLPLISHLKEDMLLPHSSDPAQCLEISSFPAISL